MISRNISTLCLLLFITISSLSAQENIDSLEAVLPSLSGIEKINALNNLAEAYRKTSAEKCISYAREAMEMAREINNEAEICKANMNIGSGFSRLGESDSALFYFNRSLKIAAEKDYRQLKAKILNKTGIVYYVLGDFNKALDYYSGANTIYKNEKDDLGYAKTISNMGTILREFGDYKKADAYTWEAVNNYDRLGEYKYLTDAYNNLAISKYYIGDVDSMLILYHKAKEVSEKYNDKSGMARALHNIAITMQERQQYKQALEYEMESLKLKEEVGNLVEISNSYQTIGNIHDGMGKFNLALEYYLKALRIAEETDTKPEIGYALSCIAFTYQRMKEYNKAIEHFEKAVKIRREINEVSSLALSLANLAAVYLESGNIEKAGIYAREANDIASEIHNDYNMMNVSVTMGEYELALENFDRAIHFFSRAEELGREFENNSVIATALIGQGRVYKEAGSISKAIKAVEKSLHLSEDKNMKELTKTGYQLISDLYYAKGSSKKAFQAFQKYHQIKQALFDQNSSSQLAEMQTKYETDKKEGENELLKRESEIKALQINRQYNIIISGVLLTIIGIIVITLISYKKSIKREKEKQSAELERIRMSGELEQAASMQRSLLPVTLPESEKFEICTKFVPAYEVGGDFYDIFFKDEGKDMLCIANADVSGKGMKAAMTTVLTSGMLAQVKQRSFEKPSEALSSINISLCQKKPEKRLFAAVSFVMLDFVNKRMICSNSGQPEPILCRDGKVSFLTGDDPRIPLGMINNLEYKDSTVDIAGGDILIFYSDALPESQNEADEQFGYDRMTEVITRNSNENVNKIGDSLLGALNDFIGDAPQYDDTTIIIVKIV